MHLFLTSNLLTRLKTIKLNKSESLGQRIMEELYSFRPDHEESKDKIDLFRRDSGKRRQKVHFVKN